MVWNEAAGWVGGCSEVAPSTSGEREPGNLTAGDTVDGGAFGWPELGEIRAVFLLSFLVGKAVEAAVFLFTPPIPSWLLSMEMPRAWRPCCAFLAAMLGLVVIFAGV